MLDILREFDVTISLGDALRPGCLDDATDGGQIAELIEQGSSRARFTAYMQGMKKLERKTQMQKEANMKGGAKA